MGIVSSAGHSLSSFNDSLFNGKSHFICSQDFPELSFPVIVAGLSDFSFESSLEDYSDLPRELIIHAKKAGNRAPLTIQTAIIAALGAWRESKIHERNINKQRIGIVVAGQNISQRYQYVSNEAFKREPTYLNPNYAIRFMDTDHVGTLSEIFEIHGEGFTIGGASASGNLALINAYRMIKHGILDICLVVGALADLSPLELQGFHQIGALGGDSYKKIPSQACRPFDKDHNGFIWGQASGCITLEASHGRKNHSNEDTIAISGVSMKLDGYRGSSPNLEGEMFVMNSAMHNGGILPNQIQYINTHGSSSVIGDETEIEAIKQVFGPCAKKVALNSTKSITGHCLWSGGIVEAIATILQMKQSFVHPSLNLQTPICQDCNFVCNQSQSLTINHAISNSFGFGGINSSVLFSKIKGSK